MRILLIVSACLSLALAAQDAEEQWAAYKRLYNAYHEDPMLRQKWTNHMKAFLVANLDDWTQSGKGAPLFNCDTNRSNETPTSVNKLTAGDIKVIGALGDSISAGNGILAETIIDVILQERGRVFSAGGQKSYDEGVITIANLLKKYNNKLYGYSTGEGDFDSEAAKLNVAVPGAKAPDMPSQADFLVQQMQDDPNVDMQNDWKMVTIFIGGNDLCRVCQRPDELGSQAFVRNMESTLDSLAASLPKTFVNIVPIMDVTPLTSVSADLVCDAFQAIACPCAVDSDFHEEVKKAQSEYSSLTAALVKSGKYDKEDFTVVFQPFLRDAKPPKNANGENDLSFFSPDCFHFSEKGHKALAKNLWNSLFIEVGKKPTTMTFQETVQCPPKGAYMKTNKNSASTAYGATNTKTDGMLVDMMAACPEPAADSGRVRSITMGLTVVGSICGALLVVVAALMVILIRKRRVATSSSEMKL